MNFDKLYKKLINEHTDYIMPELFNALKKYEGDAFVHFTSQPVLSFNLNPSHNDPIGIYAFPKRYVLGNKLGKNLYFSSPKQSKYIFIIKPTDKAKILNLDMDLKKMKEVLTKIGVNKDIIKELVNNHKKVFKVGRNNITYKYSKDGYFRNWSKCGFIFWDFLEQYRKELSINNRNLSWNILFNKTGYNAIYDPGFGIIHSNEPHQLVFFDHSAYEILDVLTNKNGIINYLKKSFPDYTITENTYKEIIFSDKHEKKYYKDFSVYIDEHMNISIRVGNKIQNEYKPRNEIRIVGHDFIVNGEELIAKIKQLLEDESLFYDRHEDSDDSEKVIGKFADYFGLSISRNNTIDRIYKLNMFGNEKFVNLIIRTGKKFNKQEGRYGPELELTINLNLTDKPNNGKRYFNFRNTVDIPDDDFDADKLIRELFDPENYTDNNLYFYQDPSYKKVFLNIVEFLRKRVFRKR